MPFPPHSPSEAGRSPEPPALPVWLAERLTGRVAVVGLGLPERGDDGAGTELARRLVSRLTPPHRSWPTGASPESVLRVLREERFHTVILVDAMDWGGAPGSVAWLDPEDLGPGRVELSSHRLPLPLLVRLIQTGTQTRVGILGIQPATLRPGAGLSPEVASTVALLASWLEDALGALPP